MSLLAELPVEWDATRPDETLEPGSVSYVRYLGEKLFSDYEPFQFRSFDSQLLEWLNNMTDELDQKTLLALLSDIFYVGRKEYLALYRSLYGGNISRWLIDVCHLNIFDDRIDAEIFEHANDCWICPITDSLRINSFLKVNNLVSRAVRPDWLSLVHFGDTGKIKAYITAEGIKRIILLEDFVGTGNQCSKIVKFAGENFSDVDILFCPLVVCPKGDEKLTKLCARFPNIEYHPQLIIPQSAILSSEFAEGEPSLHTEARELFEKISTRFQLIEHETMYGFKDTGAQVVLHSNCPNNTLQIFHHGSEEWQPLFPRVRRIG